MTRFYPKSEILCACTHESTDELTKAPKHEFTSQAMHAGMLARIKALREDRNFGKLSS